MTRSINLFLAIGLTFSLSFVFAQERVLKLAEDKKYEMYFVDVAIREDSFPTDTVRGKFTISWDRDLGFLIDDPEIIQNLKNGWVGEPGQMVGCWYDYFMYLIEDGVVVDEIRINERCKQVITKHGVYNYTDSTLSQVDRSKKITVANVEFESLEFGRNFVSDVLDTRGIYIPGLSDKDWYKYGGSMIVKTKRRNIDKLEVQITNTITEKFPNESFAVWFLVCNNRFCIFDVYCSEKLGSSMTDWEVYRNWSRFDPKILLISKTDVQMKELIEKYAR
jgi:hypothetical protein